MKKYFIESKAVVTLRNEVEVSEEMVKTCMEEHGFDEEEAVEYLFNHNKISNDDIKKCDVWTVHDEEFKKFYKN
jgi:hypothetical protein